MNFRFRIACRCKQINKVKGSYGVLVFKFLYKSLAGHMGGET